VRPRDFQEWIGHEAKIETQMMRSGRKRYRGVIKQADNEKIKLYVEDNVGGPIDEFFQYAELDEAKLVMTDSLVDEALKRTKVKQAELNENGEVSFVEEETPPQIRH